MNIKTISSVIYGDIIIEVAAAMAYSSALLILFRSCDTYEFNITLSGSFNDVKETILDVLMLEQLGIVSEIDVQATLKNKWI